MWIIRQPLGRSNTERARYRIQRAWSDEERQRRQRIAERRQRKLLKLLVGCGAFDTEAELEAAHCL